MRKVWLLLLVSAVGALSAGCFGGGGKSRQAALAESSSTGVLHARLDLGGTQSAWRLFTWGIDVDAIEQKVADANGNGVFQFTQGARKSRAITLERGFVPSGAGQFVSSVQAGDEYKTAEVTIFDQNGTALATYSLTGVFVSSVGHEIGSGGVGTEKLTLRYNGVQYTS